MFKYQWDPHTPHKICATRKCGNSFYQAVSNCLPILASNSPGTYVGSTAILYGDCVPENVHMRVILSYPLTEQYNKTYYRRAARHLLSFIGPKRKTGIQRERKLENIDITN